MEEGGRNVLMPLHELNLAYYHLALQYHLWWAINRIYAFLIRAHLKDKNGQGSPLDEEREAVIAGLAQGAAATGDQYDGLVVEQWAGDQPVDLLSA